MARTAQNTLLQVDDGTGTNFTTVAEVLDISGPDISREEIDTTSHDIADGFRAFIAGLADGGSVSFDVQYDTSTATHNENANGLAGLSLSGATRSWRLIPPPSTKRWNFSGFVTGFQGSFPVGDKQTASVTVKVSGKPTLTANP